MKTSWLLGVGMVFGVVLAAVGALGPSFAPLSDGVVARVNGKAIAERELTLALARLGNTATSSPQQQREALNYLIDQELLVQRGVAMGLLQSDHTVRKAIAMTVIDNIVAGVLAKEPSEVDLRTFYDAHQAVFTMPARVWVQHIFCGTNGDFAAARVRAEQAAAALRAGTRFVEVRQRYGDEPPFSLPTALVPVAVVHRQLGPTLADAVLALHEEETSLPVPSATGYHIFRVIARDPEYIQTYKSVTTEVKAEFIRRQRDQALQQQLDRLRGQATILLSPKAPQLAIVVPAAPVALVEQGGEPERLKPH
jgi:parvulin-like peptidyl-prolyl isomerase